MIKYEKEINLSIEEAEKKVTESLKEKGFGILTRIDVKEKLKEKIDKDMEPYIILGACNPSLAYKVLQKNVDMGYLLPCNVLVYKKDKKTMVGTVSPKELLSVAGEEDAEIEGIAEEAETLLKEAIDNV